jgi:PhzF family phenazine biosynthesis protein
MPPLRRTIRHVDAFTATPLEGNPAAVVDGDGVDGAMMQRIALNQNLSETVFLLPPEAPDNHARLRIFTPSEELPFAGHPTIAAAHILSSERIAMPDGATLRLETGAGVIPVDIAGDPPMYTMTQASPASRESDHGASEVASWIGLHPRDVLRVEYVSTGLEWLIAQVASLDAMRRIAPAFAPGHELAISLFCIGAESPEASVRVRTFFRSSVMREDPITGSSNGCIAALIAKHGLLPAGDGQLAYIAEQGIEMGQPGRIHLHVTGMPDAMCVRVGGHAVTVMHGDLLLPG